MFVGEIVRNKGVGVIAVAPNQTVVEVLRLFRDTNIGFVVVSRSPGECLGTVSERDCCNAIAEYGAEAAMMRVTDVMNRGAHVAVHAVVPAASVFRTIARLKELGGEGILVTRIERLIP